MKTALLDINILTALLWPAHEHHDIAQAWFGDRADAPWATCSLTAARICTDRLESGLFARRSVVSRGLALLAANLAHRGHQFWTESLQVPTAVKVMESRLQGYKQLTDAYLLAVAHRRKGVLATFDRGLRTLAGSTARVTRIVPTR